MSAVHHGAVLRDLRAAAGAADVEARTRAVGAFFGEVLAALR